MFTHLTNHQIQKLIQTFIDITNINPNNPQTSIMLTHLEQNLHNYILNHDPAVRLEEIDIIINYIEDNCNAYLIKIPNTDREEAIQNGEDPDTLSTLYGSLYFTLEDLVKTFFTD